MAWTEKYLDAAATGAGDGTSEANAWTTVAAAITGVGAGPAAAPTRVNVKTNASPYAQTTNNRAFNTAGAALNPVWWRGYKTTIGDLDSNNIAIANTDMPQITTTTGQITYTGAHQIISNIDFNGATVAANGLVAINVSFVTFYGCRFVNTAANANSIALNFISPGNIGLATRCYIKATSSANALQTAATNLLVVGCVIKNGAIGFSNTNVPTTILGCILDSQGSDAIKTTSQLTAIGNSIYTPTGHGINIATVSSTGCVIMSNYFSTVNQASKAAIANTSGTNSEQIRAIANGYFNCTANRSGITEDFTIFDRGTLASEAFNNPANGDFSFKPIGQRLGYPDLFETISFYRSYLDLGALQHADPRVYRGRRGK
jgi:hypothetical protein